MKSLAVLYWVRLNYRRQAERPARRPHQEDAPAIETAANGYQPDAPDKPVSLWRKLWNKLWTSSPA